jgi:hypothetical protein
MAAWTPETENLPVSIEEFTRLLEKKYPGISRNPLLGAALRGEVTQALSQIAPARLRANARLKGYSPALSDAQHTAVFKAHTGTRTYRKRTNAALTQHLRRNYGPGKSQETLDSLFQLASTFYISGDRPVIALRELIQNSNDAINAPKTGSKALGQIGPKDGKIDVVFDRAARTLTVEDNGSGMTPEIICKFTTITGTTKGRAESRKSEGEKQTGYPPFRLKVKVYPREGTVSGPPNGGRFWIRINGLYQFEVERGNEKILPADYVFDFQTDGSAGGFGVAKAVIFLASQSRPPQWELHTQDNYYDGQMADDDTLNQVCANTGKAPVRKVPRRQGTRITIFNLDPNLFNYIQGNSDPIEARLKRVLAANTLDGITTTFNGEVIQPIFPARSGGTVSFRGDSGSPVSNWFDGIYYRPKDEPTPPASIQTDLEGVTSNPQADAYPFLKGRDGFSEAGKNARWAFARFQRIVEISEGALNKKRQDRSDITFDPGNPDNKTAENREFEEALAKGYTNPEIEEYLGQSAELAADFSKNLNKFASEQEKVQREQQAKKEKEIDRLREQGDFSRATQYEEQLRQEERSKPEREIKPIDKGIEAIEEATQQIEETSKVKDLYDREDAYTQFVDALVAKFDLLDRARSRDGLITFSQAAKKLDFWGIRLSDLRSELRSLFHSPYKSYVIDVLRYQAILGEMSADAGGLAEISALRRLFDKVFKFCQVSPSTLQQAREEVGVTNPFGRLLALHITVDKFTRLKEVEQRDWKGHIIKDDYGRPVKALEPVFDEGRYARFRRASAKYLPLALMWDQAVRHIIAVTGSTPKVGSVYTGFVLNDGAHAVYVQPSGSDSHLILVNPLITEKLLKSYNTAADFAAFIHAKAVHEIAHMMDDSKHDDGHGEEFTAKRESIGFRSFPVVPLIAELAREWTGLRNPYVKESIADLKKRYRKIAEDVTCPACLKQTVEALEQTGRLDTVRWIKDRMEWDNSDLPVLPAELSDYDKE